MSNATREINRITTAIIRISVKLIVYALIILLLYEAVTKGFAFGHEIFYAEAVEEAPAGTRPSPSSRTPPSTRPPDFWRTTA